MLQLPEMRSDNAGHGAAKSDADADMAMARLSFRRTGAMSELAIAGEEYVTPIFTTSLGRDLDAHLRRWLWAGDDDDECCRSNRRPTS